MRKLLVALGLLAGFSAQAQTYKPDFDCNKPPPNNGVAIMLCQNSEAAKRELIFDQTYYALRQKVGPEGWKSLKQEIVLAENAMNQQCGLPIPGEANQAIPDQGAACYIEGMGKLTEQYKQRLSGSALEEATRDIDQHIALQQKLIDLGYLPSSAVADGVYGEGTRTAIETWQRSNRRQVNDGFLSNVDSSVLEQETKKISTLRTEESKLLTDTSNSKRLLSCPGFQTGQTESGLSVFYVVRAPCDLMEKADVKLPTYDVDGNCMAHYGAIPQFVNSCIAKDQDAYEGLKGFWPSFPNDVKQACINKLPRDGQFYQNLMDCALNVERYKEEYAKQSSEQHFIHD